MNEEERLAQLARDAYASQDWSRALSLLSFLSSKQAETVECQLIQGGALARLRRTADAIDTFQGILERLPTCSEALSWLSLLCKDPQNPRVAIDYATRAVELQPKDATTHGALGCLLNWARLPAEAEASLRTAILLEPKCAAHHHNLAQSLLLLHRNTEAVQEFEVAIRLAPKDTPNYLALGNTLAQFGMVGQAIEVFTKGLAVAPSHSGLHSALAGAYTAIRNDLKAEFHHRSACRLSPDGSSAYGAWLLNQGRFEEAITIFLGLIETGKNPAYGYYGLAQARKPAECAKDLDMIDAIEKLAQDPMAGERSRMYANYALGRICEGGKQFEHAMSAFDTANAIADKIYHQGFQISPERFEAENVLQYNLASTLRDGELWGHPSPQPIFIIGMIRSGTTLLDQIVSSHAQVASGGELRFWMEESARLSLTEGTPYRDRLECLATEYLEYSRLLAGDCDRVTDKMPLNFGCVGTIHRVLPNARFLHIRRTPVDTCLSIWTTFFGQGPLFAYNKSNVVRYYESYLRSMERWRSFIPQDRLLEIDYEELVANPSEVIPQVIDFCGLPWDDACLHHERNLEAINTPSRWQARQPIYASSLERWRRYESVLGEFSQLLPIPSRQPCPLVPK